MQYAAKIKSPVEADSLVRGKSAGGVKSSVGTKISTKRSAVSKAVKSVAVRAAVKSVAGRVAVKSVAGRDAVKSVATKEAQPKFRYATSEEVMKIYREQFEGLRPLGELMEKKL